MLPLQLWLLLWLFRVLLCLLQMKAVPAEGDTVIGPVV